MKVRPNCDWHHLPVVGGDAESRAKCEVMSPFSTGPRGDPSHGCCPHEASNSPDECLPSEISEFARKSRDAAYHAGGDWEGAGDDTESVRSGLNARRRTSALAGRTADAGLGHAAGQTRCRVEKLMRLEMRTKKMRRSELLACTGRSAGCVDTVCAGWCCIAGHHREQSESFRRRTPAPSAIEARTRML